MNKNQKHLLALAIMMTVSPLCGAALSEIEDNGSVAVSNFIGNANPGQVVAALGDPNATTAGLFGTTTVPTNDIDFYSFYANVGDVISLDIDNGFNDATWTGVDTEVGLFDSSSQHLLLDGNDDTATLDSGSSSLFDARTEGYVATYSGTYYVGVAVGGRQMLDGPTFVDGYGNPGTYDLIITRVTPAGTTTTTTVSGDTTTTTTTTESGETETTTAETQEINLEIRPGSRSFEHISPKSKGVIPVALLSKPGFNAMDIDTSTITFGANGTEASPIRCNANGQDVNGDGLADKVCFFEKQTAGLKADSITAKAKGLSRSGVRFEAHGITKAKTVSKKEGKTKSK